MFYENVQSTMMTILHHAVGSNADLRHQAIERFCAVYSQPLVDFMRMSKRLSEDDAEEVVQSFWSERFIDRSSANAFVTKFLAKKSEITSLSFRKYLSRSLVNHWIGMCRKSGRQPDVVSMQALEGWEPLEARTQDTFDIAWANHILVRVLESVRRECSSKDQLNMWRVFEAQALLPALCGAEPPGYAKICEEFGFRSPKAASNAMQTMARKFQRCFTEIVIDYLPDDQSQASASEVAELEMQKLIAILGKPGNLKIDLSESSANWSNGFSVRLDATNERGFDHSKLNDERLYSEPSDLAAAWKDICAAPLGEWLLELKNQTEAATLSIDKALTAEHASVELYDLIRSQAKSRGRQRLPGIPTEFYALVYMLAIVAAETHLQIKISSQSAEALRTKAMELSERDWLNDSARSLLGNFCQKQEL